MARLTPRRRAWTGVALVGGIVAIAVGAWGLQRWAPFAEDTEVTWPGNIEPLARFVEHTTGQHFTQAVTIEFIGDADEYAERVAVPVTPPTADDLADAAVDEAVGRALGLWRGDVSLVDVHEAYDTAPPLPVTWRAEDTTIVVNAVDGNDDLSPVVRAQLTLRLTQALDEQRYHLVQRAGSAPTSQDYEVVAALEVGHAIWVHDQYVDDMSADDVEDYYSAYDDEAQDFASAMDDVPVAYRAIRAVGQQLGPMFVEALSEEGRGLVATALSTDVPDALDQVSLPAGKYLRRDRLERVSAPPGPGGADVRFTNQMGPFALYLLLAPGLPDHEALTAADGWGNDRYTVYVLDDRVCVDVHLVADSRLDADRLENGLNGWALQHPQEAAALVARSGTDLYASVCDPGTDASQEVPSDDAVEHYMARADELRQRADASGDTSFAECVAVAFYGRFSFDVADDDEGTDYFAEMDAIEQDCLDAA